MGICLILGGSKPLPGWFGALMQWKWKFNWVFSIVIKVFKTCKDSLIYPQNGDLTKSLKSTRKKVPQSARLSAGGGCKSYMGNAQMPVTLF